MGRGRARQCSASRTTTGSWRSPRRKGCAWCSARSPRSSLSGSTEVVAGSEMVTNTGAKVISSSRVECHFGLTPGGCFDNPEVWAPHARFHRGDCHALPGSASPARLGHLERAAVERAGRRPGLLLPPHAGRASAAGSIERYGGLDGLNRAWNRRYASWEEVQPGKLPSRPYTEMMAFQHFLTWRADRARRRALRVHQGPRSRPARHGPRGSTFASPPRDPGDLRHGAEPGQRLGDGRARSTPWAFPASRAGTAGRGQLRRACGLRPVCGGQEDAPVAERAAGGHGATRPSS